MPTKLTDNQLLDRYLSGAITAPQEAELERRALADPVLGEALAGLRAFPDVDHEARVAAMLKGAGPRVRGEVKEAKVRHLGRYAAAATVLLLVVAAFLLVPRLTKHAPGELAMNTETIPTAAAEPDDVIVNTKEEEVPADLAEPDIPQPAPPPIASAAPTPDPFDKLRDRPRPEKTAAAPPASRPAPEPEAEIVEIKPEAQMDALTETAKPPQKLEPIIAEREVSLLPAAEQRRTEQQFRPAENRRTERRPNEITGRISDENGDAIAGVLVRLPGMPLGERTDTNGVFTLNVGPVASHLNISHPDYEDETIDVSLTDLEDIQLTLEYRREDDYQWKQAWQPTKISMGSGRPGYALPEEGYNNLRKRIEEGKPEGLPAGKVKLSFLVDPDGTLSDFVFRGKPSQETMDYIGGVIAGTSIWNVLRGEEPVRVYFKVEFD